ncbi:MAG: Mur ligase family protein, partial [Candidatus Methylumidiphilus sp.]
HGLDQGRLHGVRFAGGLFTNLSRDHLDYHLSMEAYLEAKLRLVAWPGLEFMAFNLDDASAAAVLRHAPAGLRKIGFTLSATVPDDAGLEVVRASALTHSQDGIAFEVSCADGKAQVAAPLYGDFNVENLLGVFAVLRGLGFGPEEAARRLRQVRAVPGRMERFASPQGAVAVVDYAHTPDALSKALASLRRHCRGKLSVVLGCGGDRDRGKRPQMGAVAAQLADHVVLTDDNPRSEDGGAIIQEILAGCGRVDIITQRDRRAAIAAALERLAPDDVLLVAGKGHEDTQDIGGVKHPFSDRLVVRQLWGLAE